MKKLLLLAIAAAFTVVTQAATFDWSVTQVREGWADSSIKADGTAYLFLVGANGASEAAVASAISGASSASALATTLGGMAIDSTSLAGGAIANISGDVAATAPAQLFFAVISDDGYAYQGAATTVTTIETLGSTTVAFGSQKTATSSASAWTNAGGGSSGGDVPEPTSGLLLLMGGAMLALRRKQK